MEEQSERKSVTVERIHKEDAFYRESKMFLKQSGKAWDIQNSIYKGYVSCEFLPEGWDHTIYFAFVKLKSA